MRGTAPLFLAFALLALPARGSVFTVTKTADTLDGACDRDCSLREAIAAANEHGGADFVVVGPGVYVLTRPGRGENVGAAGDLDVRDDLAILGAGADRTVIDGGGIDRVLDVVFPDRSLEVHGVAVRNGHAVPEDVVEGPGFEEDGGGIRAAGPLTLAGCLVAGNRASGSGGGVSALVLDARDSTVAGNESRIFGGGLFVDDSLVLENVTVSGNRAGEGGGMTLFSPENSLEQVTVTGNSAAKGGGVQIDSSFECPGICPFLHVLARSVIAGNQAPEGPDCEGTFEPSSGFNVFGIGDGCSPVGSDVAGTAGHPLDPRLSALGGHGGPTPTHALLPDSPALDLAPSGECTAADQRGFARSVDGDGDGTPACDAGSFELTPGCQPSAEALCLGDGGRFQATVEWTANGFTMAGQAIPLTPDTGAFWFFGPDNLELEIKVLDGCGLNQRFWVFLSGQTNVGVEVTVVDTVTGERWEHTHAGGPAFPTLLDTSALAACAATGPAVGGPPVSSPAPGRVFRVTKTADTFDGVCDRDCSLRDAVAAANQHPGTDAVVLGPGTWTLSRAGAGEDASQTGDLDVDGDMALLGAGADRTILDGGGIDRVLHVLRDGSLELHGVTVRNGRAAVAGTLDFGDGGGIRAQGPLAVAGSLIAGNAAEGRGGGIHDEGRLTVRDTTISGNEAGVSGGGLYDLRSNEWSADHPFPAPRLRLSNVTLSGNRAVYAGGAAVDHVDTEIEHLTVTGNRAARAWGGFLRNECGCVPEDPGCCGPSHFVLSRSVLAGNTDTDGAPDCDIFENPGGFNVYGVESHCRPGPTDRSGTAPFPLDPRLSPLDDHGGPTPTHLPLPGSPALDITAQGCAPADQRGVARPAGPGCDAGAVEAAPGCLPGPGRLCLQDGRFAVTARWTAQGPSGPDSGAGRAVPLTADSGMFWFFDPANLEMTIKVLDGCGLNDHYWVFVSGMTDVGVEIAVQDTQTGGTWTHTHAAGAPLQPRLDVNALEVCP